MGGCLGSFLCSDDEESLIIGKNADNRRIFSNNRCPEKHTVPTTVGGVQNQNGGGKAAETHLPLTDAEIGRVRQLWMSQSVDREAVCLSVVIGVLVSRPTLLTHFNLSDTTTVKELEDCQTLRSHARLIAGFFSEVLEGLAEEQRMGEWLLRYVGAVHFRKSVNFTAENYLVFKQKFIEQFCDISARRCTNRDAATADQNKWKRRGRAVSVLIYGSSIDDCNHCTSPQSARTHESTDEVAALKDKSTSPRNNYKAPADSVSVFHSPIGFDEIAIHRVMNFVVKRLKEGFLHESKQLDQLVCRQCSFHKYAQYMSPSSSIKTATRDKDSFSPPTPDIGSLRCSGKRHKQLSGSQPGLLTQTTQTKQHGHMQPTKNPINMSTQLISKVHGSTGCLW